MTAALDPTVIRTWLGAIYGHAPGWINICSTDEWTGGTFPTNTTGLDQAADYTASLDRKQGVYARVTTLRQPPAAYERGSVEDTLAIPGLWADVDIDGPGHKIAAGKHLPPDEDAARLIVTTSGLPEPTLWVHSGGGLYPWWLLATPYVLTDGNGDLAGLKRLSENWQAILARSAERLGWHYGKGVSDLARVLRVPGTVNRKEGLARPCRLLGGAGDIYTIDQLRDAAEALRPPDPVIRFTQPARPDDGNIRAGSDYTAKTTWEQVLTPRGWTPVRVVGQVTQWRRPGKNPRDGISATTNHAGSDLLWSFTDATELEPNRSYDRFGAYAALDHGGKHGPARKALTAQGYGTPPQPRPQPAPASAEAPKGADAPADIEDEPYTELGVARRLAATHGHDLRHVPVWGRWLAWDGRCWAPDDTGEAARRAKQAARQILHDAALVQDEDVRKAMEQIGRKTETSRGVKAILDLAGTEPQIALRPTDLDSWPWLLNVANGVLDLRTGQLRDHDRALHLTKATKAAYDPHAPAPEFHKFLERIQPDPAMRAYLARLLGHALVGEVIEHILAIWHGKGANGKSTLLETCAEALGDYSGQADPGLLIDRGEAHPTGVADLFGRRLVITSETDKGRRLAEGTVKRLTGGDRVKARRMREDFWEFDPSHSLVMMSNHRPIIQGDDEGIWRRVRMIPFDVVIPPSERDAHLKEKLAAEIDGILAWLVDGCLEWQREGLGEPDAVVKATDDYRSESDALKRFLDDRCLEGYVGCRVQAGDLYTAWAEWCRAEGMEPGTKTALTRQLVDRGFDTNRSHGKTFVIGLGLQATGADDEGGADGSRWK